MKAILKRNFVNIKGNVNSPDTIIFAHGFGSDQFAWKSVTASFEEQYRLVLFDHVGAGKAEATAYSAAEYALIEAYALDLIEICKALELKKAIFVGHSVGAMIGLLASISAPELFSRLVLIGASPRYLNDDGYVGGFSQDALEQLYSAMRTDYLEWASGFSRLTMRNEQQPILAADFAKSLQSLRPDVALNVARSIFQSDFRHVLAQVSNDVLLIQSENDVAVPQDVAQYLNRQIAGSRLATCNAEGHFPHISAPQEIINLIQEFVNQEVAC